MRRTARVYSNSMAFAAGCASPLLQATICNSNYQGQFQCASGHHCPIKSCISPALLGRFLICDSVGAHVREGIRAMQERWPAGATQNGS